MVVELVECECRQHLKAERLKRYAELPNERSPRTFANLEDKPEVNGLAEASSFCQAWPIAGPPIIVLQGPNGTGKSHLLEAIGREMLAMGSAVKYAFVPDLLDKLRATYDADNPDSLEGIMARYKQADVLLLDDITGRTTPFAIQEIERLVDDRHRNDRLMVVTTNMNPDYMANVWGYRLADRLFSEGDGKVMVLRLEGPSYRTGTTWGKR